MQACTVQTCEIVQWNDGHRNDVLIDLGMFNFLSCLDLSLPSSSYARLAVVWVSWKPFEIKSLEQPSAFLNLCLPLDSFAVIQTHTFLPSNQNLGNQFCCPSMLQEITFARSKVPVAYWNKWGMPVCLTTSQFFLDLQELVGIRSSSLAFAPHLREFDTRRSLPGKNTPWPSRHWNNHKQIWNGDPHLTHVSHTKGSKWVISVW